MMPEETTAQTIGGNMLAESKAEKASLAVGGAPARAHFVDAEAEKAFHELMGRLAGEDGDEDPGEVNG
jgi:hypothetical protein